MTTFTATIITNTAGEIAQDIYQFAAIATWRKDDQQIAEFRTIEPERMREFLAHDERILTWNEESSNA